MLNNFVVVLIVVVIGILGHPLLSNADTDPADADALRVMNGGLNSPQQLTNWVTNGGDPCGESWRGITCSGSRVTGIDISGLGLSGTLGYLLESLTSLANLDVSGNNFGNQIPYQLPPNLQRLNIANIGFSGGLPYSIAQMGSLKHLNVSHNHVQGQLFDFGSKDISILDFSFNDMTGNLPNSFSSLTNLSTLYIQNNQFEGTIDVLSNLPLENLNVENNRFTGWVPDRLKGINNLKMDGNTWTSGPAPPPPPGTPPVKKPRQKPNSGDDSRSSNGGAPSSGNNSSDSGKSGIGAGAIAGIVMSVLVVGVIVVFFLMKRRSRKPYSDIEKPGNKPFASPAMQEVQEIKSVQTFPSRTKELEIPAPVILKPPPVDRHKSIDDADVTTNPITPVKKVSTASINAVSYSIADLQMATESFSVENLIGEGSIGSVYRAQFDDGKVLTVKKINSSALASSEDFLLIVLNISKLHHPNVTELVGYCSEHGQYLLVNEFHKNGSLYDFLHLADEERNPLIWNTRVKIALGTARALEYLHEVCSPSVVHKHFKSSNILLDADLNPHLSDSGLASLVQDDQASHGYSAPEVSMSGQYTIKSDVYSFGVVMLELLTGRKPFDSSRSRSEQSLVRWATPQLHDIDSLDRMVDPSLEGLYPVKSISRFADIIALCVQAEPEFRPPMSEVVEALVRLVQRANMSKRTVGSDQADSGRSDSVDAQDYM
ncbi:hypothetical protein Leryth_018593 [Lithospermum erythrorhizon]|nr:hypothetical protein Leryth_018593 [Lithospermum erythrorhizon]